MRVTVPMEVTYINRDWFRRAEEKVLAARREEAEAVLRGLGVTGVPLQKALAGFSLVHVILVPEEVCQQYPGLAELAFVRSCPHISDQVLVVDPSSVQLAEWGTPAKYVPPRR